MTKEQRKTVETKLKQIWKIYNTAPWGKSKKFVVEDDVVKVTGSFEYSRYLSYEPDIDVKDFTVKFKGKSKILDGIDASYIERQIEDNIWDDMDRFGVYKFEKDYDNIYKIWNTISDDIPLDIEDWDLVDFISESDNQTEFVSYVIEEFADALKDVDGSASVKLNSQYSAKVLSNGTVKVGCQTIPIDAVEKIVSEYKRLKSK